MTLEEELSFVKKIKNLKVDEEDMLLIKKQLEVYHKAGLHFNKALEYALKDAGYLKGGKRK